MKSVIDNAKVEEVRFALGQYGNRPESFKGMRIGFIYCAWYVDLSIAETSRLTRISRKTISTAFKCFDMGYTAAGGVIQWETPEYPPLCLVK